MRRSRSQLLTLAARLAALGGSLGIAAGIAQATIGSRISDWSGHKDQPVALGLLTVALAASVLATARTLRAATSPRDEALAAFTLWFAAVAIVCSTTVGRLGTIPGALLLAASGLTLRACGWRRFRVVVATNWLRGLLGGLGALELLMAVSAGPTTTVVAGVIAGVGLIAAAIMAEPGRRSMIGVMVAATLPFTILTWWAIIAPLITLAAIAIALAVTARRAGPTDAVTMAESAESRLRP